MLRTPKSIESARDRVPTLCPTVTATLCVPPSIVPDLQETVVSEIQVETWQLDFAARTDTVKSKVPKACPTMLIGRRDKPGTFMVAITLRWGASYVTESLLLPEDSPVVTVNLRLSSTARPLLHTTELDDNHRLLSAAVYPAVACMEAEVRRWEPVIVRLAEPVRA